MKHIILIGIILMVSAAAFAVEPSIESTFFESTTTQPASSTSSPVLSEKEIEALIDLKLQNISLGFNGDVIVQEKVKNEFWYVIVLSCLSLISLFIVLRFLDGQEHGGKNMVSAAGLTLIIYGTIILVLIVDTTEQLTAAIGILGAIAGYLFRSVQGEFMPSKKNNSVVPQGDEG